MTVRVDLVVHLVAVLVVRSETAIDHMVGKIPFGMRSGPALFLAFGSFTFAAGSPQYNF